MKIIVDAFGGDNAPLSVLQGAVLAKQELQANLILTGDEQKIKQVAAENQIDLSDIEIIHAPLVMPVEADPTQVLKEYKESSLAVGLQALADGKGDAFVSGGSTGALVVGATFIVKRIKGIKRVALAPVIPSETGCYLLLDVGANTECRPEMLVQFGIMGSAYMEKIMGVASPRVALVNIGAEENKGTQLQTDSYALLKKAPIHFIGNIEPRYIPAGQADVVVADGFTGNVILKLTEGLAKMLMNNLKGIFKSSFSGKLAAMLVMKKMKAFKSQMDYTEYGGALLMGTAKPVIKAHGSSNAKAIKNAIRQAIKFAQTNVIGQVEQAISQMKSIEKE